MSSILLTRWRIGSKIWTVNGRAISPTSAGHNRNTDRAMFVPLLPNSSALSTTFTFCGMSAVDRAKRSALVLNRPADPERARGLMSRRQAYLTEPARDPQPADDCNF
jgi:hypothetical protein